MKEGWEVRPLGEVCTVVAGQSPPGSAYNSAGEGTPFYQGKKDFGSRVVRPASTWTTEVKQLAHPGDVLMSVRAPVGPVNLTDEIICIGRGLAAIRPGPSITTDFLFAQLQGMQDRFAGTEGAVFASISKAQIQAIELQLPPPPEQERIVRILDAALGAVDQAHANTNTVVGLGSDLFESHLNDVMAEAGQAYELVALSSALSSQPRNGWSPPASQHAPAGTPVLTLSAVTGFQYRGEKVKYTSANPPRESHCWLANGDLLITRSNTPKLVGHVAIYDGTPDRVIYPDLIMRMRTDETRLLTEFAYYWIRTRRSREYLMSMAGGASQTMSKITKAHVQNLPIALPPIDVQARSVELIQAVGLAASDLSANQRATAGELAKLRAALLDRAFSGAL